MFRKRQIISSFAAGSMLAMIAAPASAVLIDDTDTAKAFFGGDKTSSPGTFVEVIGSTSTHSPWWM